MQTPEEFAWTLYEAMDFHDHFWRDKDATVRLIAARDEAIRADERGRCSVVHATLTDEALVAELVRRGVMRVDEYAEPCGWRCDVVTYDYDECRHACRRSGPHAEHECVNGHTVAVDSDDAQPESTRRYVTAWGPDTRTPQQRSDDAEDRADERAKVLAGFEWQPGFRDERGRTTGLLAGLTEADVPSTLTPMRRLVGPWEPVEETAQPKEQKP